MAKAVLSLEQALLKHHSSEYGLTRRISRLREPEQNHPSKDSRTLAGAWPTWVSSWPSFLLCLSKTHFEELGWCWATRLTGRQEAAAAALPWHESEKRENAEEQAAGDSAVCGRCATKGVWEFTQTPLRLQLKFHTKRLPCWPTCACGLHHCSLPHFRSYSRFKIICFHVSQQL